MKNSPFKSFVDKGYFFNFLMIIFVLEMITLSGLLIYSASRTTGNENNKCAVIVVDGKEFRRVKLSEPTDIIFDGVHIEVKRGGISFCASDCEDKNCVKGGRIRQVGSTLACLPKKIVVQVVKIE